MKDRIGNKLAAGDKVLVELPTSSIVGFIAELVEPGLVSIRRGTSAAATPGRVLVQLVIALPCEAEADAVPQLIKVYDALRPSRASNAAQGTSEPSNAN